jgi:hypothetical protein
MTTQLEIAKMVLNEVGTRSTITALNDGSPEANILNSYYAPVRDHALSAARWNFAKRTDTLALWKALPGTPEQTTGVIGTGWNRAYPAPPWLYSYLRPEDCLYARCIIAQPSISSFTPPLFPIAGNNVSFPQALRVPFEIGNDLYNLAGVFEFNRQILLTNASSALLEYTFKHIDETQWEASFVMVMVKALAAFAAIALTSDKQIAQMKLTDANNLILQARANEANEGLTILDHVPDWLRVRGIGGYSEYNFYYPYGPLFSVGF